MKDYNGAKNMATKILSQNKNNKDAQTILSDINESEAADLLNGAVEKYEQGKYQESLAILDKLLLIKPADEWGLYYRALDFDGLKKLDEAVKQYKILLSKNPEFTPAYYSLAVDLDNLENYTEALNYYQIYLAKAKEKNEMTNFCTSRIRELKKYLEELNAAGK